MPPLYERGILKTILKLKMDTKIKKIYKSDNTASLYVT
jgi:hypothetical protein